MAFFLLFLPLVLCFGAEIELYQKPDDNQSFGYSKSQVCSIKWQDGYPHVKFNDAFSPSESAPNKVTGINCNSPIACFLYNGHSYLVCKVGNYTCVKRGNSKEVRSFMFKFSRFYFDHHLSKAYVLDSEDQLYEFKLDVLESFWTTGVNLKNTTFEALFYPQILMNLSNFYGEKSFIFNGTLYSLIKPNRVIKRDLASRRIEKLNWARLNFIPFAYDPVVKNGVENTEGLYFIALYVLDLIFILVLVYLYRKYLVRRGAKKISIPHS